MKESTLRYLWYVSLLLCWGTVSQTFPELYVLIVGGLCFMAYIAAVGSATAYLTSRTLDAIFPR